MKDIFGKPIKIDEVHDLVTRGMVIKKAVEKKGLKKLIEKVPNAIRFFLGGDCVYFFTKSTLKEMLSLIDNDEADCLAIYTASRKDQPGRPTLIACVYALTEIDDKKYLTLVKGSDYGKDFDAVEHPGGNGRIKLKETETGYEIPENIDVADIEKFLEE